MNFKEFREYFNKKYPNSSERGYKFENYAKWFLENDSVYKKIFKKIWLWDDWPGKWGPDDGIDLIAEDHEGRIWSVQSKNYAKDNIIKKGIDSFIAQSAHKDIYGMYLLTTSDNISPNSIRQMHNSEKDFCTIGVNELSRIEWPKEEDLTKKIKIIKAKPEPHQKVAIRNVYKGFKKEDRGKLIMACGTGKTLTGLWIKEKLKPKKTIIFFPSLGLLSDTLTEYCKHGQDKFNFLCVCSDISVAKDTDDYLDKVDSLSFPTTTNTNEIVEFLKQKEDSVVFSTYQSSPKIEKAIKKINGFSFDLAIFDEAHRSTGKEDKVFTKALDDKNIKCKKRLFMTATPKFASKIALAKAKEFDQEIISMDDENLYGKNFYELKFSEAIKENLLSDYRVVICVVLDSEIKKMIDKRTFVQLEEMTGDSETFANYISIAKTIKEYEIKSLITYHSNVKRAKELNDNFIKIVDESNIKLKDNLFTDHINGTYPSNKRREILDRLRNIEQNNIGIITNARCLTEGIDVPSLDGIAFVDPRQSQVDVIQAVGRAIRKVRGINKKKIGTIVVPIFITNEEEIDEVADKSAYKKIWQIVNALKDHDDLLKLEIDNLRFEMGKRTLSPKPRISKIIYDIEARIGSEFINNLIAKTIERSSESWEEMYGLLTEYKKEFGNVDVPQIKGLNYKGKNLDRWVSRQRLAKKRARLPKDRIKKLESIGFVWDQLEAVWNSYFILLKEYKKEFGNVDVPRGLNYNEKNLGTWILNQRKNKKNGKISKDRIKKLESIDFNWEPLESAWDSNFKLLIEYKKEFGNVNPPAKFYYKEQLIGSWVHNQRGNKKKGKLPQDKIKKLESIGFVWDQLEAVWNSYFILLKEYKKEFGNVDVPNRTTYKGQKLGSWVLDQRKRKKMYKMRQDKIKKLESIGFVWDLLDATWNSYFILLKEYKKEFGNLKVPKRSKYKRKNLGLWISNQRADKKNGKISQDRIKKLEDLGFVWDTLESAWDSNFKLLTEYKKEFGNINPPPGFNYKGKNLGNWVSNQRANKKEGILPKDRIKKLESIGFVWDSFKAQWNEMYNLLIEYKKEFGSIDISKKVKYRKQNLGGWVRTQRTLNKKGEITPERFKKLQALGFVWKLKQ